MTAATLICLALAWLAVSFAVAGLPRLAAAFVIGTLDLGLAGQLFPALDTDPLAVLASGTAALTVVGTVAASAPGPAGRNGRRAP